MAAPTIRVGTGILLVAQHDPIVAAKAAATLDLISGGRLSLGVGFGWNEEEMNDHGVDYRTRRDKGREHVLAMRALWTHDEASFDGDRSDVAVAEAGAAQRAADPPRWRSRSEAFRARGRVRRRMEPDRWRRSHQRRAPAS
jgi:alkanesulfonate monooxygenase SsuD/methylene tetrahydromethanopterin reductase-like flavin-dependent oxidoreductase (luciferase family)